MSFFDIFNRCKISATCRQWKAHDMATKIDPVYEKKVYGGVIERHYFRGTLSYCARQGCHLETFDGVKAAYRVKRIRNGVEVDVEPVA